MKTFKDARFITSAPDLDHCPPENHPEICFAGRSNVGKSSLINTLSGRKKLAHTSNTPGKTRLLNYYLIDNRWYLVDLPGYGYAKVSKKETRRWGHELQRYLLERSTLKLVCIIMDARHDPSALDREFMLWLAEHRIPFAALLTKSDKLSGNQKKTSENRLKKLHNEMNLEVPVVITSADDKTGIDEVRSLIADFLPA